MRISRPLVINVVLAVVVIAALVGGVLLLHPFGDATTASTADTTQLTSTVQQGVVSKTIIASGSIAPVQEATASFAVPGTIASVAVSVGQNVTAGQVLGTLDPTALLKSQATAYTALVNARSSLATAQSAAAAPASAGGAGGSGGSGGSSSTSAASQVTSAKTQLATAQSNYDAATAAVAQATLTAPISGTVIAVNGTVGSSTQAGSVSQLVTPSGTTSSAGGGSSAFVTIANATQLTVTANIAETDIAAVSIGQAASVSFPALGAESATAKVTAIAPTATASNSTVTYATTITLDTVPPGLRLGQTAEVAITTATSKDAALYVPTAAITTTGGVSTVKVVAADGTTTVTTVTLGVVGDAGTQILTGLKKGQTVVIGTVSNTQTGTNTNTNRRFGGFGGTGGGFGGGTGGAGPAGGFGGARPGGN